MLDILGQNQRVLDLSDDRDKMMPKIMIKWLVDCFIDFSVVIIDEELEIW